MCFLCHISFAVDTMHQSHYHLPFWNSLRILHGTLLNIVIFTHLDIYWDAGWYRRSVIDDLTKLLYIVWTQWYCQTGMVASSLGFFYRECRICSVQLWFCKYDRSGYVNRSWRSTYIKMHISLFLISSVSIYPRVPFGRYVNKWQFDCMLR